MIDQKQNGQIYESYLIFKIEEELYGTPLMSIREITERQNIKSVPFTRDYYLGVMNLRGQVISVIDLKKRFRMQNSGKDSAGGFIMVIELMGSVIGLLVDKVISVNKLPILEINPKPNVDSTIDPKFLIGVTRIQSSLVILVALKALLDNEELNFLTGAVERREM